MMRFLKQRSFTYPRWLGLPAGALDLDKHPEHELKAAIRETSKNITKLLTTLVGLSLFSILALGTPDQSLLGASGTLTVPLAGSIPFKTFILLGPAVILAVRLYLYAYVNHWIALELIRQQKNFSRPVEITPLQHPLLRLFTAPLLYLLVPFMLVLFAWKGAAIPVWGSISWLLAALGVALHVNLLLVRNPLPFLPLPAVMTVLSLLLGAIIVYILVAPDTFRRRLQLSRADLSKQSFIRQDFRKANLEYSNLSDSQLVSADLRGADLSKSVLRGVNFVMADLRQANLYKANLENADLLGAKLDGADFNNATLVGARLAGARLIEANLIEADLTRANLQRANLEGTKLFLSNLSRADLRNVVNLTCNQLGEALEWESAYRSPELACDAPIPRDEEQQESAEAGESGNGL